eukprot:m.595881 g.595881  ORF g.595881 m.595881 type:complete len:400 (+) comp58043_c0_seq22:61-1260(+)
MLNPKTAPGCKGVGNRPEVPARTAGPRASAARLPASHASCREQQRPCVSYKTLPDGIRRGESSQTPRAVRHGLLRPKRSHRLQQPQMCARLVDPLDTLVPTVVQHKRQLGGHVELRFPVEIFVVKQLVDDLHVFFASTNHEEDRGHAAYLVPEERKPDDGHFANLKSWNLGLSNAFGNFDLEPQNSSHEALHIAACVNLAEVPEVMLANKPLCCGVHSLDIHVPSDKVVLVRPKNTAESGIKLAGNGSPCDDTNVVRKNAVDHECKVQLLPQVLFGLALQGSPARNMSLFNASLVAREHANAMSEIRPHIQRDDLTQSADSTVSSSTARVVARRSVNNKTRGLQCAEQVALDGVGGVILSSQALVIGAQISDAQSDVSLVELGKVELALALGRSPGGRL